MRLTARSVRLATLATAAALALAACSSGSSDDETPADNSSSPAAADAAFPLTLKNTFGETVIESKPERVATVAWGNHDVPLALGVVPVGMAASTYGDDDDDQILPWTFEALQKLGATGDKAPTLFDESDGIDFEAVNDSEPDVVLASYSGLTKEEWTQLNDGIAPTVSYPVYAWGTNWKDMTLINGEAMGLKSEAQAKVDEVLAQIKDATQKRPELAGKTFVYTYLDASKPNSLGVYSPLDARVQLVTDFGLTVAPSITELAGSTDQFYFELSAEQADKINDVDILVTYGDENTLALLQAHPLLGKVRAIKNGAVVVMPSDGPISAATSGPSILSVPWVLDDYLDLFQAAAKKVG